ncbi:MAG: type 4a pilus biogenesis protein PilO [Nitrospirae bacterium]|nr:type 4a pilus biogenesis protein PilO [Nitrospirota bacterium]
MNNIKLNDRERYLFFIALIIAIGIFINFGVNWYKGQAGNLDEQIESRRLFLKKQVELLSDKDIKTRFKEAREQLVVINDRLLAGNNPHIASAQLQKSLSKTAGSIGVKIDTVSVRKPEDLDIYLKIPIELTLYTSIDKLTAMLLKIETSKIMLSISNIRLNTDEKNVSKLILVTMTVSGYMKKESI